MERRGEVAYRTVSKEPRTSRIVSDEPRTSVRAAPRRLKPAALPVLLPSLSLFRTVSRFWEKPTLDYASPSALLADSTWDSTTKRQYLRNNAQIMWPELTSRPI